MQTLLEWLQAQPFLLTAAQIVLDVILIVVVLVFFMRRPKALVIPGRDELLASFERIIRETKEIAEAFDSNLEQRQQLIQQVLTQLDSRLEEAQITVDQLQNKPLTHSLNTTPPEGSSRQEEQQEIQRLASQGLDVETIAQRIKKPRGEVELILKLQRLTKRPELA
jgi:hypothetical protein